MRWLNEPPLTAHMLEDGNGNGSRFPPGTTRLNRKRGEVLKTLCVHINWGTAL